MSKNSFNRAAEVADPLRPQVGVVNLHSVETVPLYADGSMTIGAMIDEMITANRHNGKQATRIDVRLGDGS